ncbi:hypothetical protein FUA23_14000 [Neolewinella aurantiaca]|uniref:Uncharacterized protein n=1 Tax=Neolewinella aurantiaca TaxID=2602767 RepID=A0A5C7FMB1_9BACT|nr:hypothetical protein [Neolewinella aurantiaca]TXF88576.1 hypothetical protein FUA23_14000 [Neolewinella aurantiaca]
MQTFTSNLPAQTALGKFYLHPWDSQVLVDWAKSLVQQGKSEKELTVLSGMDRSGREDILNQFGTVVLVNNIAVSFDEFTAVSAYLNDLRTRVLADKITPEAAFAQVRPLAYDLNGIQLTGLSELDEDLNLLDSGELPFYNKEINASNKKIFIRRFFSEMDILPPLNSEAVLFDRNEPAGAELRAQLESSIIFIFVLAFFLYLLILLMAVG